jgi:hypothetical protein
VFNVPAATAEFAPPLTSALRLAVPSFVAFVEFAPKLRPAPSSVDALVPARLVLELSAPSAPAAALSVPETDPGTELEALDAVPAPLAVLLAAGRLARVLISLPEELPVEEAAMATSNAVALLAACTTI